MTMLWSLGWTIAPVYYGVLHASLSFTAAYAVDFVTIIVLYTIATYLLWTWFRGTDRVAAAAVDAEGALAAAAVASESPSLLERASSYELATAEGDPMALGTPDWSGTPDSMGTPEWSGTPDCIGTHDSIGTADSIGTPECIGTPDSLGTHEGTDPLGPASGEPTGPGSVTSKSG
jgi:hypothetical protein